VTTLFCVRPQTLNIGNDAIFMGMRQLLREAFGDSLNIVQVPAMRPRGGDALGGLLPETLHQMNLYGDGVIVGGGNLYENGELDLDVHALREAIFVGSRLRESVASLIPGPPLSTADSS
jgi:hypothetical protein